METLVPSYTGRVCGDEESWRKVLESQGYGNGGTAGGLIVGDMAAVDTSNNMSRARASMHENMRYVAHQYYANTRPHVEITCDQQAAAILVRRRESLISDMVKVKQKEIGVVAPLSLSLSVEDADTALRALAEALLQGANERNQALKGGGPDLAALGFDDSEVVLTDQDKQHDARIEMVTGYLVERMCIPRDMGCLAARAIRKIAAKVKLQK
jgi:hypothetical protein